MACKQNTYRSDYSSKTPGESKNGVGAGGIRLVGDITNGATELRCQLRSIPVETHHTDGTAKDTLNETNADSLGQLSVS